LGAKSFEDALLCTARAEDLFALLSNDPSLALNVARVLTERLDDARSTMEDLAYARVGDRIEHLYRKLALEQGAYAAEVNNGFEEGGAGAAALAEAVVAAADEPSKFDFLYPLDAPIEQKIEAIAKRVYGADGIFLLKTARDKIAQFAGTGIDKLPICMAKTHLSLSHDASLTNAPTGFTVTVRDLRAYTGAGWIVALCGDMQTMPGYGANPAAVNVDIDSEGRTVGLF